MRLIDADELKKELDEQMNFEENCRDSVFDIIDDAPTVAEVFKTGSATGLRLIERPQGEVTDCENCQFKKFSEDLADKLAKVMIDNGITDFDEFAKSCGVSYLHQDSITKSDTQKGGAE